jgi:GNAT superfamily N-acetyltransferase
VRILTTRPEYAKNGIGSSLIKWGIQKADEEGLPCWLDTDAKVQYGLSMGSGRTLIHTQGPAFGLYQRLGFEMVDTVRILDLEDYGLSGVLNHVVMVRQPKSAN